MNPVLVIGAAFAAGWLVGVACTFWGTVENKREALTPELKKEIEELVK